jgi:hypothetical protein
LVPVCYIVEFFIPHDVILSNAFPLTNIFKTNVCNKVFYKDFTM